MPQENCNDLERRIATLEKRVDFYMELLSRPGIPPITAEHILNWIALIEKGINSLQDQLSNCWAEEDAVIVIIGVERTQAIQYFSHNGQGSDYAPDNSVPLIALRPLVLRVYIDFRRVQQPPQLPVYFNGNIKVDRIADNGSVQRVTTLYPINGPVHGRPAASIDRGNANHTLNFRLPAANCQGGLKFTITVSEQDPVISDDTAVNTSNIRANELTETAIEIAAAAPPARATITDYARFNPVPPFRVRGILVHYMGPNPGGIPDLPAPTGLDFVNTLQFMVKTYPIGRLEFGDCVEVDFDGDLTAPSSGCGPGWEGANGILTLMKDMQNASDDNAIYIALPSGFVKDL